MEVLTELHDQPQNGDTDDHTPTQLKPQLAQRAGRSLRDRVFGRWLIQDVGSSLRFSMGDGSSSIAALAYVTDNACEGPSSPKPVQLRLRPRCCSLNRRESERTTPKIGYALDRAVSATNFRELILLPSTHACHLRQVHPCGLCEGSTLVGDELDDRDAVAAFIRLTAVCVFDQGMASQLIAHNAA